MTLDPRTVAYWLAQEHCRPRKPRPRSSTLAPCTPALVRLWARSLSAAAQVFQRRRARGVDGGSARVQASVRAVRPRRQAALLPLAFAPGACAQGDWGALGAVPGGQTCRPRRCFVMVLCSSRRMDGACTVSQTMEPFLACHQPAGAFFGGIPHHGMVETLTSAVLKRAVGAAPGCTPTSLDFAHHRGCPIAPGTVGKGHEKGRVEHGGGSVTKHCLAGLALPDCSALPPAARPWLDTVAHGRLHGATRDTPTALWHTERSALRPLPLYPFDIATVSQVRASRQFRITLETNRYSVPAHYAGQALTLKTYPDRLCIYRDNQLIARHARSYDRFNDFEDPDHPKPLLAQRKKARDQPLFRRVLALSPPAEASALTLEERRLHPPHHVRPIVAGSDLYAPASVARAMDEALLSEAFSAASIANRLEHRTRCTPEARALPRTRREALLDVSRAPPDLRM